jgi:glyoxylate/hydroxypyruvate reductase A
VRAWLGGELDVGELAQWRARLDSRVAGLQWVDSPARAEVALVANPASGALRGLTGLRLIQSLWAGVERLLTDPELPPNVPIARMVDPAMTDAMVQTASWAVLSLHRGFFAYARRQQRGQWKVHAQRRADEVPVLALGLGALGGAVAARLAAQGYPVTGWHSTAGRAAPAGVRAIAGPDALAAALPAAQVVVNLLPLTPATRGVLDARLFAALPRGAGIVNLGRGAHLVEADLLAALDAGRLAHAVLDVFETEPLPAAHPFWTHPRVTVLPHAAALTDPRSAADVVADNLRRLAAGEPLRHLVDRTRGY